jgi:chorismate mutase
MTTPTTLKKYRNSIDDIDNHLIEILSERFKLTELVGRYKARNCLAETDLEREREQRVRIRTHANHYGLDPHIAWAVFSQIIALATKNHTRLAKEYKKTKSTR